MNTNKRNQYYVTVTDWTTGNTIEYGPYRGEVVALRKAQMIATERGWTKVSDYHYIKMIDNGEAGRLTVDSAATDIQIVEADQAQGESIVLTEINNQTFAEMAVEEYMPFPPNIVKVLQFAQQHSQSERILVKYTYTAIHTTVIIDHDGERGKTAIDIVRFDTVQKYSGELLSIEEITSVLMRMFYGED